MDNTGNKLAAYSPSDLNPDPIIADHLLSKLSISCKDNKNE